VYLVARSFESDVTRVGAFDHEVLELPDQVVALFEAVGSLQSSFLSCNAF
jgi:hypothetical protein